MYNSEYIGRVGKRIWKSPDIKDSVFNQKTAKRILNLFYGGKISNDRFSIVMEFENGFANLFFSTEQDMIQISDLQFRLVEVNDEFIALQFISKEE